MISLRPRLRILFDRARILLAENAGFHDIACDHAKLAAAIALVRPDVRIEASDILQSAIDRARLSTNLSEAELFVSDGFAGHSMNNDDVVVIAGVGGHTIVDLLEEANNHLGGRGLKLQALLQTNQQIDILRENLYDRSDVEVIDEFLVRDRNLIYVNFQVELYLPWTSSKEMSGEKYKYYGGGPLLIKDGTEPTGDLEHYLRDCLKFAEMKIHSVTQTDELILWQEHHQHILGILKRGEA